MNEEVGYLNHIDRFRMFPFVGPAIRRLNQAGLAVIVVSNQSGVARGYFPESFVNPLH
jgi:D-glycero-D-manno-heptose 1,7-bisphosphate phosphatase